MTEREYLAALCSYTLFGPQRIKLMLGFFGTAEKVWKASENEFFEVGLKEGMIKQFIKHKINFEKSDYFSNLKKRGIKFVTITEDYYPQNLKEIEDYPQVLYYLGKLEKSDLRAIAIVGTRKMSDYGSNMAQQFASELSRNGVTIVSGLALGVDAAAHKATVMAGGRGIVVLASGLDIISPFTNAWIAKGILQKGGAIVSECPLGFQPIPSAFPIRNRIITGLSKGVLVIEGEKRSGTMMTARIAAEQGRTVFAVPGPLTSTLSEGPNYLIQNGAKMAISTDDILDELDIGRRIRKY